MAIHFPYDRHFLTDWLMFWHSAKLPSRTGLPCLFTSDPERNYPERFSNRKGRPRVRPVANSSGFIAIRDKNRSVTRVQPGENGNDEILKRRQRRTPAPHVWSNSRWRRARSRDCFKRYESFIYFSLTFPRRLDRFDLRFARVCALFRHPSANPPAFAWSTGRSPCVRWKRESKSRPETETRRSRTSNRTIRPG